MLNKKGLEEEGMKFNTSNIAKILLFLFVIAVIILVILPRVSTDVSSNTLYNFGSGIFEMMSG